MICIYCQRDLPQSDFSREHVIPRAFGTFAQNLTLIDLVCADCNQYFGETIDFALARGSAEAVHRLDEGVKPPQSADDLRRDRVRIAWTRAGDWNGVLLRLTADSTGLVVEPVPQIGFARQAGDGFIFVPEEVLADPDRPLPSGLDPKKGLFLIANSDETEGRLVHALEARGITFREHRRATPPLQPGEDLPVEVRTTMDSLIFRCVAKIAFNYLAYTQPREFVLHEEFSAIRQFIRYDHDPGYVVIVVDSQPILRDDSATKRQTNGHLVTVNWAQDRSSVVAQVSLFNHARYRISLARGFRGVWREIRSGHHFDVQRGAVNPLVGTSLILARRALPNKALQLTANSAFQLGLGSLLAFNLGASATVGGAVGRS